MKFIRLLIGFLALFLPASFANTQPAALTWPDAVADVAQWRTIATACVGSFKEFAKEYSKEADIVAARMAYAKAKSDSDAVIAGLITALSEGGKPESLSDLHARLERSVSNLEEFCKTAERLVPNVPKTSRRRSFLFEILNAITKEAKDKLYTAVASIYEYYKGEPEKIRETIRRQLEAARWPDIV